MLELLDPLNNVVGLTQPKGCARNKENIPLKVASMSMKTTWQPCLITTSSTGKNVLDVVLVNWKWPELTNNEPKSQILSLIYKKLMNDQGTLQAITMKYDYKEC